MDEVEFGGVGPVGFDVVDFEVDIWRDPARLDGAEVVAKDLWVKLGLGKWRWPLSENSGHSCEIDVRLLSGAYRLYR